MFEASLKRLFAIEIPAFFARVFHGDIGVYIVVSNKTGEEVPLTFTRTYKQARLAVARLQYFDTFPYYSAHCLDTHQKIGFELPSWRQYAQDHPIPLQVYHIQYIRYSHAEIASILRRMTGSEPLYLPYENPSEALRYFLQVREAHNGEIVCSPRTQMVAEHDAAYAGAIATVLAIAVTKVHNESTKDSK